MILSNILANIFYDIQKNNLFYVEYIIIQQYYNKLYLIIGICK